MILLRSNQTREERERDHPRKTEPWAPGHKRSAASVVNIIRVSIHVKRLTLTCHTRWHSETTWRPTPPGQCPCLASQPTPTSSSGPWTNMRRSCSFWWQPCDQITHSFKDLKNLYREISSRESMRERFASDAVFASVNRQAIAEEGETAFLIEKTDQQSFLTLMAGVIATGPVQWIWKYFQLMGSYFRSYLHSPPDSEANKYLLCLYQRIAYN